MRPDFLLSLILLLPLSGSAWSVPPKDAPQACVVLLHGLARTHKSMTPLRKFLEKSGFGTANISYASRKQTIEILAPDAAERGLEACRKKGADRIHFVTHSMGGILVRQFLATQKVPDLGRVVMLSPPNHGSEVADKLSEYKLSEFVTGPAGGQLGTDSDSVPLSLGPANFEVGIITGNKTFNPLLSLLIPGADDGKVSVESAQLEGMTDFLVVRKSHVFIMRNHAVMEQVVAFLNNGAFEHPDDEKKAPTP